MPVYEGWKKNPDGSFDLLHGYFAGIMWRSSTSRSARTLPLARRADQGQPTHFLPRRSRFLFRVRVSDFGDRELVWTLTGNGKTEKTYATLNPGYFIDDIVIMNNNGAGGSRAPTISKSIRPRCSRSRVTEFDTSQSASLTLAAVASDDGVPERSQSPCMGNGTAPSGVAQTRRQRLPAFRTCIEGPTRSPSSLNSSTRGRTIARADSPYSAGWDIPPPVTASG